MDWTAIALSVKLAALVSAILLFIALPLAHWLTFARRRWTFLVEALVALPLVLPPTVLGFYVLVSIGSRSPVGRIWTEWTGHGLAFTFEGLVLASTSIQLAVRGPADRRRLQQRRHGVARGLRDARRLEVADIRPHHAAALD